VADRDCAHQPDGDDDRPAQPRRRRCPFGRRAPTGVSENLRLDQPAHREQAEGDEYEIVEKAEDGDEVGDQVNRTQRVGDHDRRQHAGVPRASLVADGKVQCRDLPPEVRRPLFPLPEPPHLPTR
jgi:hypothetical protein